MKKTTQVLPLILMTIACGRGERPQAGVTEVTAFTESSEGQPLSSASSAARIEGSHAFGNFSPDLRSLCLKFSGEGSQPVCCAQGEARWNADFFKTLVSAMERGTESDKVCPAPSTKQGAVLDNRPDATSIALRWSFRSAAQSIRESVAINVKQKINATWVRYRIANITQVKQKCWVTASVKYINGDKVSNLIDQNEIILAVSSGKYGSDVASGSLFNVAPETLLPGTLPLSAGCNGVAVGTEGGL